MPGNKYLLADKSKLLRKKLENLTATLQGGLGNESLQTQEQYIFETIRALGEFYKALNEPELDKETIEQVRTDDLPDPDLYNKIWQQVLDDLTTLFTELENVEDLTVANFNFITTENNRLTSRLKAVDSKLGDYILYSLSPSKDTFFFKDSFNDLSKVDVNSGLLNAAQCEVGQAEGIVTLPLNQDADSLVIVKQSPIINPNSNGVVGNNQETGAAYNGNLSVLLDNNPDTWFEYERVVQAALDDKEPLILDMTMNLGEERVINHIRVNPNNFGTKTVIQIEDIKTSIDGQVYTSIKDDIPIAGFTTQDEENIFNLAPSTSKFAGQGLYTFTPRKVKYIQFVFKQAEPYVIETPAGQRLRYAIGIRDIDVRSYEYQSSGEIVSTPFESQREIRKVLLETNQNPTQISELARIQYFISPDDGGSWFELQPFEFDGPSGVDAVTEVLNFNTGDSDQIATPVPVNAIRLKAVFTRNDDAFQEGSSSLNKRIITRAEIHPVPQSAPFNIELEQPPVDGTVAVVDPLFGSRGVPESQYVIGHSTDRLDTRRFRLPFLNFPRPFKKVSDGASPIPTWHVEQVPASEYMHVEVGGEEWPHATQPLANYTIDFDNLQNYKLYTFNPNNGILAFGDSLTTTLAPADNQPVTLYFDAERLFPSEDEDAHLAQLEFKTSSNKDDMIIKRYDEVTSVTETFPRKAMVIRLAQKNIIDTTDIASALNAQGFDASPQEFVNGRDELSTTTSWSIDTTEGIIYTGAPTSATTDASATYTYQPITTLSNDDWDWATSNLLRDSVEIRESAWTTISVLDEQLPDTQNAKVLDVSKLSVVKGTLSFSLVVNGVDLPTDDDDYPFVKEVDYINGVQELGGAFLQTTENIPTDLVPVANVATFDLKENISTLTAEHPVSFTNTTLFTTAVASAGLVNSPGEYFVDRSGGVNYGKVYFYTTATVSNPGKVTYYYSSPTYANNGLYSVDYALGRIHTQRPINPNADTYELKVTYQYTDYRAEYRIARELSLDSYEVDITNQTVTINDNEILKHLQIPKSGSDARGPLYLVNYDYVDQTRENIEELADKFSPVLKDYALRLITKGRVV